MNRSNTRHAKSPGQAPYPPVLDHQRYRRAAEILVLTIVGAALYFAVMQRWFDAAAGGGFAALGASFLAWRDRLPSLFSFLFLVAGAINLAGYIFGLWKQPAWFDELVHAGTSFAVMAALAWLLLGRTRLAVSGYTGRFTLAVAGTGVLLGLAWELFEWVIGIIGGPRDTIIDLVMDTAGAVAAALFCAWAAGKARDDGRGLD